MNFLSYSTQTPAKKQSAYRHHIKHRHTNIRFDQSSDSNIPANSYIKVNPKNTDNQPKQNDQQLSYNGKYYSIIDFVNLLKSLYENGNITSDEFIPALAENGIDTSNITVEDGTINWGYLHITTLNEDTKIDDTNSTAENESVNVSDVEQDSAEVNDKTDTSTEENTE